MITYRKDFGCYWPNYDHKPEKCFQFVQRGLGAMDEAIKISMRNGRTECCIQAGGHAGHWALKLSRFYKKVLTFEPEIALFACLRKNTEGNPGIKGYNFGLGASAGNVRFKSHASAGSWRVDDNGEHEICVIAIDELSLTACDAIFLDIEGYEPEALRGARKTIEKFSPIVHVEMLPRSQDKIRSVLTEFGYRFHSKQGRDAVYVRN